MRETAEAFYDDLAESYHWIYQDWEDSIAKQAAVLGPLIERLTGRNPACLLDCSCGIGTQALGLALRGHRVVASDLSRSSLRRAESEARQRNLDLRFHLADMRALSFAEMEFDAILAADNSLPHLLSQSDLEMALRGIANKLRPGGVFVATIRDYDRLAVERPTVQPPAFYDSPGAERIVHQIWRWHGETYEVHLYLTLKRLQGWQVKHFHSEYRALRRADLNRALSEAGFEQVTWMEPAATSFYQPIVTARKATSPAGV